MRVTDRYFPLLRPSALDCSCVSGILRLPRNVKYRLTSLNLTLINFCNISESLKGVPAKDLKEKVKRNEFLSSPNTN